MKYNITENKLKKNGYTFVNKNYRMYYKDISNGGFTIWLYTKYKVITISQWGGDIDKVIDFYLKNKNNKDIYCTHYDGNKYISIRVDLKTGNIIANQNEIDKLIKYLFSWKFWKWKKSERRLNELFEVNKTYYHKIDLYDNEMNTLFNELKFLTNNEFNYD